MDKPDFVPPPRLWFETDLQYISGMANALKDWGRAWAAAQSQPAAESVDVRETSEEWGDLAKMGTRAMDRHLAALRTPAREVPDSEVPTIQYGSKYTLLDGPLVAEGLRAHGLTICKLGDGK